MRNSLQKNIFPINLLTNYPEHKKKPRFFTEAISRSFSPFEDLRMTLKDYTPFLKRLLHHRTIGEQMHTEE